MPAQQPYSQRQEASCLSHDCDDCRSFLSQNTMRIFKGALARNSKHLQPSRQLRPSKPSSTISIHSLDSKDFPSPDDSDDMSSPTGSTTSRPQSSQGPQSSSPERRERHRPRRPTLKQIMADEAEAPWTLAAFTQYAAQNMCLENIQFIHDAHKYRDMHFGLGPIDTPIPDAHAERLSQAWHSLIFTYIRPGSPREVNIPGDVRAALVKVPEHHDPPPHPEHLMPAIHKVYELIEDSILPSFFTDVRPQELLYVNDNTAPQRADSKRRSSPVLDNASISFAPTPAVRRSKVSNLHLHSPSHGRSSQSSLSRHGQAASGSSSTSAATNTTSGYAASYSSYTAFTDVGDDHTSTMSPLNLASPTNTNDPSNTPPITPPPSEHDLGLRRASPRSKSGNWQKSLGKIFGKNNPNAKKSHRGSESAIQEE